MITSRFLVMTFLMVCFSVLSFSQEVKDRRFSVDISAGIANADFFSSSATTGVNVLYDLSPRWQTGVTYEHYFHETLVGFSLGSYQIFTDYSYGYTLGLNVGYDFVVKPKIRLGLLARPTFSQAGGTITETFFTRAQPPTTTERSFSTSISLGVGLQLRGEYDFSDRFFGLFQLGGHEDLGEELSRLSVGLGGGVRF